MFAAYHQTCQPTISSSTVSTSRRADAEPPTGSVHLVGKGRSGYNRWKRITGAQSTRCGQRRRIACCGGRYGPRWSSTAVSEWVQDNKTWSRYQKHKLHGVSKTGPIRFVLHNFVNSRHFFGKDRPYSVRNWYSKKFLNWFNTNCVVSIKMFLDSPSIAALHFGGWNAKFKASNTLRALIDLSITP